MGTESYLIDHKKKTYYFLGKGAWQDDLIKLLNSRDDVVKYVTEVIYHERGGEGAVRLGNDIFDKFTDSLPQDLEVQPDDIYPGEWEGYTQVADAWEVRCFYRGTEE